MMRRWRESILSWKDRFDPLLLLCEEDKTNCVFVFQAQVLGSVGEEENCSEFLLKPFDFFGRGERRMIIFFHYWACLCSL